MRICGQWTATRPHGISQCSLFVRLDKCMAPDESISLTVNLTIQEAIGIIGDLHHMVRLNRATSQEEAAAWGRVRPGTIRKLTKALESAGWKPNGLPDGRRDPS
jgi:hypothetical protein